MKLWKWSLCGWLVAALVATAATPTFGQSRPAATQPATRPALPKAPAHPPATTKHALPTTRPASRPVTAPVAPAEKPGTHGFAPAGKPAAHKVTPAAEHDAAPPAAHAAPALDFTSMLFVFMLATFIGIGVIRRVSRLLHTPLMSLTNAISAIAVVGSIVLAGSAHYPNNWYHFWGAVALFASMTNIVSGFLITDRMLKMFKTREAGK